MKLSRMILIGATLPFALLGDASSKPPVKAEECYLLGFQCVEGDGSVKDYAAAAQFLPSGRRGRIRSGPVRSGLFIREGLGRRSLSI